MRQIKAIPCLIAIVLALQLGLSGCATNVSPNTYELSEVGVASKVVPGVILSKRAVTLDARRDNIGTGAGAVIGGVTGSALGGRSHARTNIAGAVGGAVIGGLVGSVADKAINKHQGFEYMVKLKHGNIISVAQSKDLEFFVNQRVLVIYGATTRIVPDETQLNR